MRHYESNYVNNMPENRDYEPADHVQQVLGNR